MLALRPDVDVPAVPVLVSKPPDRSQERLVVPDSWDHQRLVSWGIGLEEPDFKDVGSHRVKLRLDSFDRFVPSRRRHVDEVPLSTKRLVEVLPGRLSVNFSGELLRRRRWLPWSAVIEFLEVFSVTG